MRYLSSSTGQFEVVPLKRKPTTAKSYKMALDRHILPSFGAMPLKEVGPAEAAALHHRMRDMPSMANRAVWVLSRLFVLAETWEIVPRGRNPCRHIEYYPEKSRERFLTPEEFRRLRAALRKFEAMGSVWASGGRCIAPADADRVRSLALACFARSRSASIAASASDGSVFARRLREATHPRDGWEAKTSPIARPALSAHHACVVACPTEHRVA